MSMSSVGSNVNVCYYPGQEMNPQRKSSKLQFSVSRKSSSSVLTQMMGWNICSSSQRPEGKWFSGLDSFFTGIFQLSIRDLHIDCISHFCFVQKRLITGQECFIISVLRHRSCFYQQLLISHGSVVLKSVRVGAWTSTCVAVWVNSPVPDTFSFIRNTKSIVPHSF